MPTVHEDPDKRAVPSERLADEEPGPLPPMAPDGGIMPMPLDLPPPLPKAVPEEFVCLRGPCRHYVELTSLAEVEVKVEGWQPVQKNRYCRVLQGAYLDLTEDSVFECNRWDPPRTRDPYEEDREQRQKEYLAAHPECVVADTERVRRRQKARETLDREADVREAADAQKTNRKDPS